MARVRGSEESADRKARPAVLASAHLQAMSSSMWSYCSFPDSEVVVDDGRRWPTHRCVLAAGSTVFRRMLESGMQETQQERPRLVIKDHPPRSAKAFLRFLYTGQLPPRDSGESQTCAWS